ATVAVMSPRSPLDLGPSSCFAQADRPSLRSLARSVNAPISVTTKKIRCFCRFTTGCNGWEKWRGKRRLRRLLTEERGSRIENPLCAILDPLSSLLGLPQQALSLQEVEQENGRLLRRGRGRVDAQFRLRRRLVGVVDAGELRDLPGPRLLV